MTPPSKVARTAEGSDAASSSRASTSKISSNPCVVSFASGSGNGAISNQSGLAASAPTGGPSALRGSPAVWQRSSPSSSVSSSLVVTSASPSSSPPCAVTAPSSSGAGVSAPRQKFTLFGSSRQALRCPYCGPSSGGRSTIVLDSSSGDQLCRECGLVVEERVLSEEQEWRNFSAEASAGGRPGSDRNRVGDALDGWLEDGGAGTSMLVSSNSSSSKGGLGSGHRLQLLHEAATAAGGAAGVGSRDRQLKAAFSYLRLIGEAFSLREQVLERAKEIAKELLDSGQLRSRSTAVSMLAVTYLACREAGVTRTVKELVVYDRAIGEKDLGKAINRIKKILPSRGGSASAESATQLLPRYCSRLQLSMHLSDVAEHIARQASQLFIASHRPNSVAAAAIWLVVQLLSNGPSAQSATGALPKAAEVASVTGTGEHTLRAIYKDMLDVAEHLLPKEFQPAVEGSLEALRAKAFPRKRRIGA